MKDEIKEILDNVKKCCDITKDQSFTVYQRQDILKLLDYITNLQEKLKISQTNEETYRLEMEDITKCLGLDEHTTFDEVKEKATNLQERKIMKEDVDKYFEENMCVSFDKFIENWNEQEEWANYYKKENDRLKEENELHNKILKQANDVLNLQTEEGNYNYDRFMLGVYNGMEAIVSLFEQREPKFKCEENIKFLHETDYKSRNEKSNRIYETLY